MLVSSFKILSRVSRISLREWETETNVTVLCLFDCLSKGLQQLSISRDF
jgi:hypothetical protein